MGRLRRLGVFAVAFTLLLLPLLPALRASATASILYVDNGNPSCSNSGQGTQAQPYCSINTAAQVAVAGQTVQINAGTYSERVKPKFAGAAGQPVVYTAAAGAAVTVSGGTNGFYISNLSYITVQNLTITQTSSTGVYSTNSNHIVIRNNHVSLAGLPAPGSTAHGITLSGTTASSVIGNTVDHNTDSGIYLVTSSTGNDVAYNVGFNNAQQWQRSATGIDDRSAGNTIEYNLMHDNEDSGIQLWDGGDTAIIRNNIAYNNGDHGIDDHDGQSAIIVANSVYRNCTSGINVEGTASNTTIENNIAVDNAVYPAYNNIACSRQQGNIAISTGAAASTSSNFNLVNLTTTGIMYLWGGTKYTSLQAMQSATGQESRGLQGDPKWKSPASWDLHLVEGSPAIDSADSGNSVECLTDLDGNPRVDDAQVANTGIGPRAYDDRGAYEFQADNPPTAVLSVIPNPNLVPLAVTADASQSSDPDVTPIATYKFDFGDGTVVGPQAAATAGHTYSAAGSFLVTVTVTDSAGLASQASATASADGAPAAALTVTPSGGSAPVTITADASSSTDTDSSPISTYSFDFGDSTGVGPQPASTAAHQYALAGTYTVRVTVTDSAGLSSTATATVNVTGPDAPPAATLTVTPAGGGAPLAVTADASRSTDNDSTPIASYSFDFGDGTVVGPQAAATAGHTYTAAGTYTLRVTVTDTGGLSAATSTTVVVDAIQAALTVAPVAGAPPLTVTADASASSDNDSSPIAGYTFDFGDGTVIGPQASPMAGHTYTGTGSYRVTLTVTDTTGLTATATVAVITDAPPAAALSVSPSTNATNVPVTADASKSTDADSTPIATYRFDFGDGTVVGPQASATATHAYATAGAFTVTTTVTDTAGNSATATATVVVRTNLVTNPGFETNTTGWNTSGSSTGVTLARVSGGDSGGWSGALTSTAAGSATCVLNDSPNWVATTAAGTYTVSGWFMGAGSTSIKIQLREYVGSTLVGQAPATSVAVSSSGWTLVSITYTPVQPGASTLDLHIVGAVTAPGNCYYADDLAEFLT